MLFKLSYFSDNLFICKPEIAKKYESDATLKEWLKQSLVCVKIS